MFCEEDYVLLIADIQNHLLVATKGTEEEIALFLYLECISIHRELLKLLKQIWKG